MRVLYFTRDYTTHDRRFLMKLAASDHEIFLLRLEDDGILYESRPVPENIRIVHWRAGRTPRTQPSQWLELMPDFCKVLEDVRPDLIHAGPVQSCGFITALSGFHPFLLMSWGSDLLVDAHKDPLWRWITQFTLDRSDYLFCDCNTVRDEAIGNWNFREDAILQRSWGVDLRTFAAGPDKLGIRERLGWQDCFVILCTRTWEPIYGLDVMLEAFRRAREQNPELRLLLLGGGSQAPTIKEFIRSRHMQDFVHCPGMVPHVELPDYFRAADLYASCSYSDGSSVSLLEAMATQLPVVVTDCGGNREWIVPGRNGWLAAPGDPGQFAESFLAAAAMDSTGRGRMGQANREIVERGANWDDNFADYLTLYDKAAVKSASAPFR